jgi:hypothetical protein
VRSLLRSHLSLILLPLPAVMLVACDSGPPGAGDLSWRQIVEEGRPVMITEATLDATREVRRIEEVMRFTDNPDDQEGLLHRPVALVTDAAGDYFVLDHGDRRIAVFDARGRYLRSFGRRGAGPGEFESMELVLFDDPWLVIWDAHQRRTTRYRTDGTLQDVTRHPVDSRARFLPLDDGGYLLWQTSIEERDGVAWARAEVLVLGDDSTEIARIETARTPTEQSETRVHPLGFTERISSPMVYAGMPSILLAPPKGLIACEGELPEVRWYDFSGNLLQTARIEGPPRPVTSAVRQAHTRWLQQQIDEMAARMGRPSTRVEEGVFTERVGFGRAGSFLDHEDNVWIPGVWTVEENPEGGPVYHIFAPDGRYLGVCRPGWSQLPAGPVTRAPGRLLAVIYDEETGEQVPTIYRIDPVPES